MATQLCSALMRNIAYMFCISLMKENAYTEVDSLMKNSAYRFRLCSHEGICLNKLKSRFSDEESGLLFLKIVSVLRPVLLALMKENACIQVDSRMKKASYFSENGLMRMPTL